jgi:DTW domain-containing protein
MHILILRHPQETKKEKGTAEILCEVLPSCTIQTGLSWANLSKALGPDHPASKSNPNYWGILYLGARQTMGKLKEAPASVEIEKNRLYLLSRKENPIAPDEAAPLLKEIQGLIVLDGNWAQAKTMWWRNSWFLKAKRLVLLPDTPSLYGKIRREPRKEALSTLEAVARTLTLLGQPPEKEQELLKAFEAKKASWSQDQEVPGTI